MKKISYGEKYGPAMEITDQAIADLYFEELVAHSMSFRGTTRTQAEIIERANLGYWAGYYNDETRRRVERLFRCEHPVFGKIAEKGPPSFEQAFKAGKRLANKSKR